MPRQTTKKLREIFDTEGQEEFETAARNIMFACAALINHVSGPSKLLAIIDTLPAVITDNAQTVSSTVNLISQATNLLN